MDTYENPFHQPDEIQPEPAQSQPAQPIYVQPVAEPVTPAPAPKKKRKFLKVLLALLIALALVVTSSGVTAFVLLCYGEYRLAVSKEAMENKLAVMQEKIDDWKSSGIGIAPPDGSLLTPAQVYEKNSDAVVAVISWTVKTDIYGQTSQGQSSGSGFFITETGYVVTNYHVVENGTNLKVLTKSGQEYPATVVGYERSNDICLLKVEGDDFPYVKMGSSDRMAVGDQVVAVGNPLGELTSTLTVGYISAKDRTITTEGSSQSMLQTDAAINSGNSGGPLFNMLGEVIGITSAKYSGTSNSGASIEGISFAIPISDVEPMLQDLMTYGYIKMAYLGVSVHDVPMNTQAYGVPAGAYVANVTRGGAAYKAGVQEKDIIVNIGGYEVRSLSELTRVLQRFEPGDETTITVYRYGKEVDLRIIMDEKTEQ